MTKTTIFTRVSYDIEMYITIGRIILSQKWTVLKEACNMGLKCCFGNTPIWVGGQMGDYLILNTD